MFRNRNSPCLSCYLSDAEKKELKPIPFLLFSTLRFLVSDTTAPPFSLIHQREYILEHSLLFFRYGQRHIGSLMDGASG